MLRYELSKIVDTTEKPVAVGATVTAEGQALVNDAVGGGVKPSTGAAGEIFAGISMAQQLTPLALPKVDRFVVAADKTITLSSLPLAGTLRVTRTDTGAVVAAAALTGDGLKYTLAGAVITVDPASVGITLEVTYRYAPTTLQVKVIQGDIPPGGAAALLIGSVGMVTKGDVVTTEFDTAADWSTVSASVPIKLAANGLFTVGGSGATVAGAYVVKLPSADAPFLGIHINA
jgi:hypothetical protein